MLLEDHSSSDEEPADAGAELRRKGFAPVPEVSRLAPTSSSSAGSPKAGALRNGSVQLRIVQCGLKRCRTFQRSLVPFMTI